MTDPSTRAQQALFLQRLLLSGIIAAHGVARLLSGGVDPFGTWLDSQNIPAGMLIAYCITTIEIVGAPLLAIGLLITPLCLVYTGIYLAAIVLVHAPEGWFDVGLGRNGMEYSVLLIVCLLSVGYLHAPDFTQKNNQQSL